jgi:hypothetical protein
MYHSAGEAYTHLLVSVSKTYRPTAEVVCRFLEWIIQAGAVGVDHKISFRKVVRVEPRFHDGPNTFTGKGTYRMWMPSRRRPHREDLSAVSQAVALAEQEQEYDVSVESTAPPTHPPLDVGAVDKNGDWQRWEEAYYLAIRCRVRNCAVRLCPLKIGEDPNHRPVDAYIPTFDEDCAEDELDGLFEHPLPSDPILIRNAGCARFWIEFEYGKWLYPRLKNNGVDVLDQAVVNAATDIFGTAFIEACLWQ